MKYRIVQRTGFLPYFLSAWSDARGQLGLPARSRDRVRRPRGSSDREPTQREEPDGTGSRRGRGDSMTWRDHTWELFITAVSWLVALMALAAVFAFVAYDAQKERRRRQRR